jgi:hypothetical protein
MTLDEMKDYVRDKDIILVGNSLDALELKLGESIDNYDITVRFGKGLPEPITFDRIGTNTHIWVTGQLRMNSYTLLPRVTKILFNDSIFNENLGYPDVDHLSMYTRDEIDDLAIAYGATSGKRISVGALTAHYFGHKCTTWKSLTIIHFDAFTKITPFHAQTSNSTQWTASWHLPMLRAEHANPNYRIEDLSPAHDTDCEIRILNEVLALPNVHWRGDPLTNTPELLEQALVKYTPGRTVIPKP